jgi:hypothetical protein
VNRGFLGIHCLSKAQSRRERLKQAQSKVKPGQPPQKNDLKMPMAYTSKMPKKGPKNYPKKEPKSNAV